MMITTLKNSLVNVKFVTTFPLFNERPNRVQFPTKPPLSLSIIYNMAKSKARRKSDPGKKAKKVLTPATITIDPDAIPESHILEISFDDDLAQFLDDYKALLKRYRYLLTKKGYCFFEVKSDDSAMESEYIKSINPGTESDFIKLTVTYETFRVTWLISAKENGYLTAFDTGGEWYVLKGSRYAIEGSKPRGSLKYSSNDWTRIGPSPLIEAIRDLSTGKFQPKKPPEEKFFVFIAESARYKDIEGTMRSLFSGIVPAKNKEYEENVEEDVEEKPKLIRKDGFCRMTQEQKFLIQNWKKSSEVLCLYALTESKYVMPIKRSEIFGGEDESLVTRSDVEFLKSNLAILCAIDLEEFVKEWGPDKKAEGYTKELCQLVRKNAKRIKREAGN